ncbi:MAG: sensor histidine kinase [Kineosporiaceae bacterium]
MSARAAGGAHRGTPTGVRRAPDEPPGEPDAASLLLSRWLTGAGLVYRCVAAPASVIGFLGVAPVVDPAVRWVLAGVGIMVVAQGAIAVAIFLGKVGELLDRRWVMPADLAVAVGLNIALAAALPTGTQNAESYDVAWFYLVGAVATWSGTRGLRAGAVVMLVGIPLQLAMTVVNGIPLSEQPLDKLVVRQAWLAIGFALSSVTLALYWHGRRLARREGQRQGRAAERTRQLRDLHDTVLQTLEAIALVSSDRLTDPHRRLATIRSASRAQAAEIRELLERDGADPPPAAGLAGALRRQAAAATSAGLEVRLVVGEVESGAEPQVDAAAVDAARQAVGEALTNVGKHAGVSSATVRAAVTPDAVRVQVADEGRGFEMSGSSGYGVRQSILARMREVGGSADIRSAPGRGTVVTLTVPRVDTPTRPPVAAPRRSDDPPPRLDRPTDDGSPALLHG